MTKRAWGLIFFILCAFGFLILSIATANGQKLPDYDPYHRWVTDLGKLYTPEQNNQIHNILANYEKSTSCEIAVLTVCEFESSIEDFSQKTATKWGIGKKGVDNGVLITISKCKHVFRVETGYGLEGYLPDGWIKLKQVEIKKNFFQYGKYYEGTVALIDSITTKIGKEYSLDHNNKLIKQGKGSNDNEELNAVIELLKKIPWWVYPIIIGAWIVLFFINPELAMNLLWIFLWVLTLGKAKGGGGGSFGGGKFGGGGSSN